MWLRCMRSCRCFGSDGSEKSPERTALRRLSPIPPLASTDPTPHQSGGPPPRSPCRNIDHQSSLRVSSFRIGGAPAMKPPDISPTSQRPACDINDQSFIANWEIDPNLQEFYLNGCRFLRLSRIFHLVRRNGFFVGKHLIRTLFAGLSVAGLSTSLRASDKPTKGVEP